MIGLSCDQGAGEVEAAARIAQTAFKWNEQRMNEELAHYQSCLGKMIVP